MSISILQSPEIIDAIGVAGFGLYVLTYTLLTFNKLNPQNICYFFMNFMAATMVLIGLTNAFNLASALIQIFWISISVFAICMRLRRRKEETFVSHLRQIAAE